MYKHLSKVICLLFLLFSNTTIVQAKTFKIATLSPDGSDWMQKMRSGAKEIKQKTNGRVKFKFYPGGVMGDDQAVLRKIRIGQLHGGALGGGSLIKANTN
ncbi:MAG: TRAP transporter substrate-binding protein DctP [gamma proteobacterium symbiont of Bathyaustriella thionipta]|nr:TRAP transporter substrate-binding protein DctP [gamma proteobacterium symbiont of Bathyaustriella thionipta]MCU7958392.1 TRAP transporter substrate-binding protein DctP [gamma proteobacterium symbiont of Bathyaustriella thionipta]MCU7967583.1 TRAP transporter substrate-binding protein DctP [gamma proteobacterium symbiont of Bathyaustriella thionipta]